MNNTTWVERRQLLYQEAENPDVPEAFFIITVVWLSTCGGVGIILNGVVLGAFFKTKSLQTPFNYVLITLVFMDFLMTSIGIPLDVLAAAMYGWKLGQEMCVFLGFVMTLSGMGSLYTLTALSVQRCIYVSNPTMSSINGSTVSFGLIAFVLVSTLAIALSPVLGWSEFVPETSGISCAPSWMDPDHASFAYFLLTFGFCIPLTIVFCSSFLVLIRLKQHSQTQMSLNKNKSTIVSRERKVTFMVLLMVVAFLVAWSPYAILCFLRLLGIMSSPTLVGSAMLFAKSSGSTNPIIFIFLNTQFRKVIVPDWFMDFLKKPFGGSDVESKEDDRSDKQDNQAEKKTNLSSQLSLEGNDNIQMNSVKTSSKNAVAPEATNVSTNPNSSSAKHEPPPAYTIHMSSPNDPKPVCV